MIGSYKAHLYPYSRRKTSVEEETRALTVINKFSILLKGKKVEKLKEVRIQTSSHHTEL